MWKREKGGVKENERDNEERKINTLSERLARSSGISCCNLETRSVIWASVISEESPDCLERDLLLDIVN